MNKSIVYSILVLALAAGGCGKQSASTVAVIDLDKVASAMGWMDEMAKSMQSTDAVLKSKLEEALRGTLKTIDDAKKTVAAEAKLSADQTKILNAAKDQHDLDTLPLSKEEKQKLMDTVAQANTTWQTALNNYQQYMQGVRTRLIVNYREKIRPVARQVATSRGMTVVLTTSDNLLYFDPDSADITQKVIDEMRKNPPKGESAAAPAAPPAAAPASK